MSREIDRTWMNKEFMEKVFNSSADPIECDVDWAVNPGDNQTTNIYRVKHNGKSVVVKTKLEGVVSKCIEEVKGFEKEFEIYGNYMNTVRQLVGHNVAPNYYSVENMLVLEDMKPKGYAISDRLQMLDYKRAKIVFKVMAEYHAVGYVTLKRQKRLSPVLEEQFFYSSPTTNQLLMAVFKGFVDATRSWPEVSQHSDKLEEFVAAYPRLVIDELTKETDLETLIHGDLHSNNILFPKDEAQLPLFVDFQICARGSIALDIIYFTNLSVQDEVLENNWNHLLLEYISSFNSIISESGIDFSLTLDRLQSEIDSYSNFELCETGTRGPIFLAPEKTDLSQKLAQGRLRDIYKTEVFKRRAIKVIKKHHKLGLL